MYIFPCLQAIEYDQQISALDAEAIEMEREQRELLAAEQRFRAFQSHRHGLTTQQVHLQLVSLHYKNRRIKSDALIIALVIIPFAWRRVSWLRRSGNKVL